MAASVVGRLVVLPLAAAAVAFAAKRLMANDSPVESLPEPVRPQAARARDALLRLRERFREAVAEGKAEQRAAEAQLTEEYLRKARRGGPAR